MLSQHKIDFLSRYKYELLLFGLVQHLFITVVLPDRHFYADYVWPANMLILGVMSIGVFVGRERWRQFLRAFMALIVTGFPFYAWVATPTEQLMLTMTLCYFVFFLVIFSEVLRFLIRPSRIDRDIISAAICGYLLLLETGIFLLEAIFYLVPDGFSGVDTTDFGTVYLDMVYFCSMTITSIGYGDISPSHHIPKMAVSIFGVMGQLYSIILVGILVGKYSSATGPTPVDMREDAEPSPFASGLEALNRRNE